MNRNATRVLLLTLLIYIVVLGPSVFGFGQTKPALSKREPNFVGSESCKGCHTQTYNSWKQTRMANVGRDPKILPDAVLGSFGHPIPVLPFGLDEVAFVYGSRYKQRYFTKRGDDY